MKKRRVVIGGLLFAGCLIFLALSARWRESAGPRPAGAGTEPWAGDLVFEVQLERPRRARPLFGILPKELEAEFLDEAELFDQTSPDAELHHAGPDGLDITAKGWRVVLDVGDQGELVSTSHLVFPFGVGGRRVGLRCYPADPPGGYLQANPRPDSERLDGSFSLELTRCENAASGKSVDWPPTPPFGLPAAPLILRGSFAGATP